ncbi:hypothetical protein GCM10027598_62810 [Amycolatopsis oliviviridis]|uniref:Uncharacterized protein n=1 Tax=Amycolatopsis oliviviridis TaxID=1471590 RepID=A0ABQ3M5K8_9PSEU|nr:hypothetical protein [Amycolatopsis oliviviridis]GHH33054.1 hypothetical protein GCM10017790_71100 [Amycolatopsis oliviviridis]
MKRTFLGATILALGLSLALGGQASAADAPSGAPTAADLAAVSTVVTSDATTQRLAKAVFPGGAKADTALAARTAKADPRTPVAVYQPTAGFIAGTSAVPAELAYVATPATLGNGDAATVWSQREGSGWSVYNVASGDVEKRLAARAGKGYLLSEPQAGAWYAVDGDTVTVLDGSSVAKTGETMTLAAYREALQSRYGDKLPGSTYDRTGAAGGYGSAPVGDTDVPWWPYALGAVFLAAAGAAVTLRLRRQ